jgi:zinc transporter 1/2/3
MLSPIASMHLIKGVMSAISAGMLIYAATVEMIAGDFVFGDVDGGHHHHHVAHQEDSAVGHGHTQRHEYLSDETHERGRGTRRQTDIEDAMVDVPRITPRSLTQVRDEDVHPSTQQQAGLAKRVLAVVSLLMGVGMMILAALGE